MVFNHFSFGYYKRSLDQKKQKVSDQIAQLSTKKGQLEDEYFIDGSAKVWQARRLVKETLSDKEREIANSRLMHLDRLDSDLAIVKTELAERLKKSDLDTYDRIKFEQICLKALLKIKVLPENLSKEEARDLIHEAYRMEDEVYNLDWYSCSNTSAVNRPVIDLRKKRFVSEEWRKELIEKMQNLCSNKEFKKCHKQFHQGGIEDYKAVTPFIYMPPKKAEKQVKD